MYHIGFIGVGGIASIHLENVNQMEEAQITAVCDTDEAKSKAVGQRYGANAYSNHLDMMKHEQLDAVYVCIPPFAHGEVEFAVIEHQIPMFVEKPLAMDRHPADAIVKAVEDHELLTAVGYNWRYSEASNLARTLLEGKKTGMAQGYWYGDMPMVPWWRKMDGSGGQMVEQTTHIVDLSRYLLGEVTQVYAAYANREMHNIVEGTSVPDTGSVLLQFESGAIGTISNTCLLNQGYMTGLDILTRDLVLEVRGNSLTERIGKKTIVQKNETNPYLEEDQAFIEAVKTGNRQLIHSDYKDAFKTHLVTMAANESAASGKPVVLNGTSVKTP